MAMWLGDYNEDRGNISLHRLTLIDDLVMTDGYHETKDMAKQFEMTVSELYRIRSLCKKDKITEAQNLLDRINNRFLLKKS